MYVCDAVLLHMVDVYDVEVMFHWSPLTTDRVDVSNIPRQLCLVDCILRTCLIERVGNPGKRLDPHVSDWHKVTSDRPQGP